jgi:hypothetical protein
MAFALTIHILAAVAEHEREAISRARTSRTCDGSPLPAAVVHRGQRRLLHRQEPRRDGARVRSQTSLSVYADKASLFGGSRFSRS